MNYDSGLSASDVAVLTGRNNSNDGFGDGNGWWIILFLIVLFGGWGNRGFGGFGGCGNNGTNGTTSVYEGYVLNNDFSQLSKQISDTYNMTDRKFDAINNSLCSIGYQELQNINGVNSNIAGSTAAIQQTLTQGFSGINTGMVQQGYETRIGINGVNTQLAQCCCDLKGLVAENKYENAQNVNALNNNINAGFVGVQNSMCMNTRDIIASQESGTKAILDAITANRIEDKNAQIAAQQNEINSLRLAASQSAQNEYLLNSLRNGCPVNAQLVCGNQPIPVQYIGAGCNCNCNSGCGCGM